MIGTFIGISLFISVALLLIGYGIDNMWFTAPAYLWLYASCIYFLIISIDNLIGIFVWSCAIIYMTIFIVGVIIDLISSLKKNRK